MGEYEIGGCDMSSIDHDLDVIRDAGYKMTNQRTTILRYLAAQDTHPTVEMIHQGLADMGEQMSVATIYNTLEMLQEVHLVLAIDSDVDGKQHFDYFGKPHYHAVCTSCGLIVDGDQFDMSQLAHIAHKETGFQVSGYHVEVYGLCEECQLKLKK